MSAAVAASTSIREVLFRLGLKAAGGNYATVKRKISAMNLSKDHFTGQLWNKGQTFGPKRPISDYLSNTVYIASHSLKRRLYNEGLRAKECAICTRFDWMGKPLTLELDHIDGNHFNNNLENLRILCPNCHSQTSNFRGKNIGNYE